MLRTFKFNIFFLFLYTRASLSSTQRLSFSNYLHETIYIIEQSPDSSCPFSTGGKFDSFLPCKLGLMETGTNGCSTFSSVGGVSTFSFSLVSSGSLLELSGFVMLILIRDGAAVMGAGVDSNSTFPSIELFTAAYVVSTVISSGSNGNRKFLHNYNNLCVHAKIGRLIRKTDPAAKGLCESEESSLFNTKIFSKLILAKSVEK